MLEPKILFEDNHCLLVEKPARMLTASDKTGDTTLLEWCRAYVTEQRQGRPAYVVPIHFLDRPVSGVVIFAKSSKAAARLNEAFRSHKVQKTYRAICEGVASVGKSATLTGYIVKDRERNLSKIFPRQKPESKFCELSYEVLSAHNNLLEVEVKPKTGRSHQIRCQMADAGLPLYGDKKYGSKNLWGGRIGLHALSLEFPHPTLKELIKVAAPLPQEWRELF